MKYCTKCLMPDTKPYLSFDRNGVCNACQAHEKKHAALGGIDWAAREREFDEIIRETKAKKAPFYDVLVPVSGGKDSLTQVHRLLKYDLRILAVNVDYGIKTEVGQYNLALVPKMGASLITYRPELQLHRRLIRIGFEDFGDPDLLSHTLLHAYPLHVALQFRIPLVLHGENSAFEYGGDTALATKNAMSREWFTRYAANSGHDARYISEHYHIPMEKLRLYDFPDEIEHSDTRLIFMSYYFFWDSEEHLRIAEQHGFKKMDRTPEGTFRNYVGIDEKINRLHQYMKVLKFGYGRATDHACEDIRNGRLTRAEAKALVREFDLQELSDYYIDDFLEFIGMSRNEFLAVLEKSRNMKIWKRNAAGKWYIPDHLKD
ncbi:MAG: N-acetyl sugar amidotransferase [Methanoregula sp.]|jgi:N-acetyl sugar amidotransferase|uniref:N-acetyl sugar amidotransferase n=1 Tax=Methanoregula sp. TaxID=2052170 RepID=UPI003D09A913